MSKYKRIYPLQWVNIQSITYVELYDPIPDDGDNTYPHEWLVVINFIDDKIEKEFSTKEEAVFFIEQIGVKRI